MQKQTISNFVFLPVPAEQLALAEINVFLPMQYYVSEGKLVVENVKDVGEVVCDGDCGGCPMSEMEHDSTGKCKCTEKRKGSEVD